MPLRHLLQKLNRRTVNYPAYLDEFARDARVVERALVIVPMLYFFLLFRAFLTFSSWTSQFPYDLALFEPRWGTAWMSHFGADASLAASGMLLGGMLFASFFFAHRWARIVALVSFWQFHAFVSSFGAPDHTWLVWIYPLLFLALLPDLWRKCETTFLERKKFLIAFTGAQVYLGIIYTWAGASKLVVGINQFLAGEANAFSPDALALHVADWLPNAGRISVLGPFIVEHPLVGWPLFLGLIYFQITTLWIIFKPALHRTWGAVHVVFYIANFLIMGILFIDSLFLLAALLVASPFERPGTTWRERAREAPLFGWFFRRI